MPHQIQHLQQVLQHTSSDALDFLPAASSFQNPVLRQMSSAVRVFQQISYTQGPCRLFAVVECCLPSHKCFSLRTRNGISQTFRIKMCSSLVDHERTHLDFRVKSVEPSTYQERGEEGACLDHSGVASASSQGVPVTEQFRSTSTVGILGGISAVATASFMKKLVEAALEDEECGNIPLLLSCGTHLKEKAVHDTSREELLRRPKSRTTYPNVPLSHLVESRIFLERSGARCIVLPCHISHLCFDKIVQGCSVPVLHIAVCLADELNSLNLSPIEVGSRPKIGMLGTEATLQAGFYQQKLMQMGFDVILPDKATMEHAVLPGIAAMHRQDMEGARNLLRIAVQVLLVSAANVVVLACQDMASIFPPEDPLLKKCIDPFDSLSRATVRWARAAQKQQW